MCEMSWPGLRAPRKCCVGPFGVLCTNPAGSGHGARKFLAGLENQLENFRAWDTVGWAGLGLNHSSLLFPGGGQESCMGGLTELHGARGGAGKEGLLVDRSNPEAMWG